ncbi:hypothetical protein DMB42_09775 [Nonomuraea sp. WAC 01424]|uniref:hypothetical protein n=1 Tax=Nonomuraea sp. WAC 01424 TaxID=2203200 RepID=UPI000F7B8CD1|nr:hypothetical protein [Nonomuraea sp. WAC 01424]RSN12499.1 hypothetical protein DMB42_09775 [Nonomuraea sp. WAC 01424]
MNALYGGEGRRESGLAEVAHQELTAALAGRPLVGVERFSTALRTGYTGPAPVEALRPALSIGCYAAWDPALPGMVVAAEDRTRTRSVAERTTWVPRVRHEAARHLLKLDRPPVVFTWYDNARLRELAGPGATIAAVDAGVRAAIESKHLLDDLLRAAGVPAVARIPCVHVERLPGLAELRRAVGSARVVVQAGRTADRRGTVVVSGEDGMARAARLLGPYRVAAYVPGWPCTIAVLSVPDRDGGVQVYADRPAHASAGVAELGAGPLRSAGGDWSRPWPTPAAALLIECAERIAIWAWRRYGAAGLFNVKALLTPGERVYLSAIKWRHQQGTEVSAVNQQAVGLPPFVLAHLSVMLGGQVTWLGDAQEFNQLTLLRAVQPGGPFHVRVRLARDTPVRVAAAHGPGVYRLDGSGRLRWVRRGAHPSDARAARGEFLLADLPEPDVVCHPGADLATIEGVAEGAAHPFDGPDAASPAVRRIVAAVEDLFDEVKEP